MFSNYERVKKYLGVKLINLETSREHLGGIPWTRVLDLAKVYTVILAMDEEGMCTALVNDRLLRSWGIDKETLDRDAEASMKERFGVEITDIEDMLLELWGNAVDDGCGLRGILEERRKGGETDADFAGHMFVLTNDVKVNGAACMTFKDVISDFAEKIGGDFYIIPSSIHEVILLPCSKEIKPEEVESLISDVNCKQLAPEEVLSNNLYFYDSLKQELMFACEDAEKNYAA